MWVWVYVRQQRSYVSPSVSCVRSCLWLAIRSQASVMTEHRNVEESDARNTALAPATAHSDSSEKKKLAHSLLASKGARVVTSENRTPFSRRIESHNSCVPDRCMHQARLVQRPKDHIERMPQTLIITSNREVPIKGYIPAGVVAPCATGQALLVVRAGIVGTGLARPPPAAVVPRPLAAALGLGRLDVRAAHVPEMRKE